VLRSVQSIIYNISPFLPVVNCHFETKGSGPEEHAGYETDAMPSTVVEDGDE
jgi:hypothetical protein